MTKAVCSIIIPAYNHGKHLERSVGCALRQTYPDIEIIVVDDGSTDDTPIVIRQYEGRVRYIRTENRGPGPAKNIGITESTGKYLQFLDADDSIAPEKIETHVNILEDDDGLDLVYCDCPMTQPDGTTLENVSLPINEHDPLRLLVVHNPIPTHAACVRRRAVVEAGMFDETREIQEDWDLWIRLALGGCRFRYVPGHLAHYHRGAHGVTSNNQLMFQRTKNLMEKFAGNAKIKSMNDRYYGTFMATLYIDLFRRSRHQGWWHPARLFLVNAVRADLSSVTIRLWLFIPEMFVYQILDRLTGKTLPEPDYVHEYSVKKYGRQPG